MFFDSNDISLKITTVLNLEWENTNKESAIRNFHALSYRIKGNGTFNHNNGSTTVKSGDIVFVPAFYKYSLASEDEQLIVIHFNSSDNLPDTIKRFRPNNAKYFEQKFNEICEAWTKKQLGYEFECKSILFKIMMKIERDLDQKKPSVNTEKFLNAIEYIHDHFTDNDISVDQLSKMSSMSDTYFRKLFVENFSVTPLKYINNLRLNYALELLASGYYSISEISYMCGFDSIYYFSAFIKKETGNAPSFYT